MSAPARYSSPVTKEEMRAGDGARHIQFIQQRCRVTKTSLGGKAKTKLRLRKFQQLEAYRMFARDLDTGKLKHRAGILGMGRKNGKSGFGSGLVLSVADDADAGGELYICAGDRNQAGIVGNMVKSMVRMDPYLSRRFKVYRNEIVIPKDDIRISILSADAATKDGYDPIFVMFDEVHAQPNAELWDAMALGMGARIDPMMLGITTAGKRYDRFGRDTLCYRLYDYGRQLSSGEMVDPSFYFTWWEPTAGVDADHMSVTTWEQANPGFGDLLSEEDLRSVSKRTDEPSFRTKRCNLWVSAMTSALPKGSWAEREDKKRKKGKGRLDLSGHLKIPTEWVQDSVGFLDGSWSGDSTGVVNATRDGFVFVTSHYERKPFEDPNWRVPVNAVKEDLRKLFDSGMRLLLLDPYRWQQTMADLEDEGFPVVEWATGSLPRILPAWKDYYAAIGDGEISHDGNPALQRHHDNMVLKIDGKGSRPTKEHATSVRHIDLAICSIGAYTNRNLDIEQETKRKPWIL